MYSPKEDIAQYLAEQLMGSPEELEPASQHLHLMTARLPLDLAAMVIELAGSTDKSRVEMIRLLIIAGIDSVFSRMPEEVVADIRQAAEERFQIMTSEVEKC